MNTGHMPLIRVVLFNALLAIGWHNPPMPYDLAYHAGGLSERVLPSQLASQMGQEIGSESEIQTITAALLLIIIVIIAIANQIKYRPSTPPGPPSELKTGPVHRSHGHTLPAPEILGTVYEGTTYISVTNCLPGATVKVYESRGDTLIGSAVNHDPNQKTLQVEVNTAGMTRGSQIYATQTHNGMESSPSTCIMVRWDDSY